MKQRNKEDYPYRALPISVPEHACNILVDKALSAIEGTSPSALIEKLKSQAVKTRDIPLDEEMIETLGSAFAKSMQKHQTTAFLSFLLEKKELSTVGSFIDAAKQTAVIFTNNPKAVDSLGYLWEKDIRSILKTKKHPLPDVIAAVDLNHLFSHNAHQNLGFGAGIISGKIIEFRTSTGNHDPYPVHPNVGFCKDKWIFSFISPPH